MSNNFEFAGYIKNHIDSHKTAGYTWPTCAEFAVKFFDPNQKGDKKVSSVEFFLNRTDLENWILDNIKSDVAFMCYAWDLGPNPMPGLHRNVDRLALTAAERGE